MIFKKIPGVRFHSNVDDLSTIYAEYKIASKNKSMPPTAKFVSIDDPVFARFLRNKIIPELDDSVSARKLTEVIRDEIVVNGNSDMVVPKVRIAGNLKSGLIEYALYDNIGSCVQVTADGWSITQEPKHKFLQQSLNKQQVFPQKNDCNLLVLLRKYVNVDPDSLILLTSWIVQNFCEGKRNAVLISAESGSGKTVLTGMIRAVLDPSSLDAITFPDSLDGLVTTLTNAYFVAFDNVSMAQNISKVMSDTLCCSITGAAVPKRELFTTNSLAVFKLQNALMLNGIDAFPEESDLASRCLLLKLKPLTSKTRKTEEAIADSFAKDPPLILGCIFNTLQKAIKIIERFVPRELPRMASAYVEMAAIAIALGISEEEFYRIYTENREMLDKIRAGSDLVDAVVEFMNKATGKKVEGKVSHIYSQVKAGYSGGASALPKSPSHFSRKLKSEQRALATVGITVSFDDTYADGTYIKIIKK